MHLLFAIPPAGSPASIFNQWKAHLHPDIKLLPLELILRDNRANDYHSMRTVQSEAEELLPIVKRLCTDDKYSVFGHSVGALVGYELVQLLQRQKVPVPKALYIAGKSPPDILEPTIINGVDDKSFAQHIEKYGGLPKSLLENPRFFKLFLPSIRSDVKMSEEYIDRNKDLLHVPIVAISGSDEKEIGDTIHGWDRFTDHGTTNYIMSGSHFAIFEQPELVSEIIAAHSLDS